VSDSQTPGATPDNDPTAQPSAPQTPPPAAQPTPPAYAQAPAAPAAPQQPGYAPAPGYAPPAPAAANPGRTLGIVAFIVAFFFNVIGLILGIVAMVQSKKAGAKNGFALAAIIIGAVSMVLAIIVIVVAVTIGAAALHEACSQVGPGVHQLSNGTTLTCS
jgi:hypothetical protein